MRKLTLQPYDVPKPWYFEELPHTYFVLHEIPYSSYADISIHTLYRYTTCTAKYISPEYINSVLATNMHILCVKFTGCSSDWWNSVSCLELTQKTLWCFVPETSLSSLHSDPELGFSAIPTVQGTHQNHQINFAEFGWNLLKLMGLYLGG